MLRSSQEPDSLCYTMFARQAAMADADGRMSTYQDLC